MRLQNILFVEVHIHVNENYDAQAARPVLVAIPKSLGKDNPTAVRNHWRRAKEDCANANCTVKISKEGNANTRPNGVRHRGVVLRECFRESIFHVPRN